MDQDEIQKVALGIYKGEIFTSAQIGEGDHLETIFMPIVFMDDEQRKKLKDVHLIYEYMSKAGPRSINGNPCFFSFCMANKEDTQKIFKHYQKIKEAVDSC